MWKVLFFKYTSAVLALVGSAIGISMYLIYKILLSDNYDYSHNIFCLFLSFSFILALVGFKCGKLMHTLHYYAYRDQLTNLWNSRYFYSQLAKEIDKLKRSQFSLCVALIDLDDFKMVNDTYGHAVGDEVLRKIGTILIGNTRDSDIVVRWGGDEFAIIFPNTNLESASSSAERLRAMVEISRECRQVTISIGVLFVQAEMEVAQLLKMVDDTLYTAKQTKNLVALHAHS